MSQKTHALLDFQEEGRSGPALTRKRRRFTASYKLSILDELERSASAQERGAILRREGGICQSQ